MNIRKNSHFCVQQVRRTIGISVSDWFFLAFPRRQKSCGTIEISVSECSLLLFFWSAKSCHTTEIDTWKLSFRWKLIEMEENSGPLIRNFLKIHQISSKNLHLYSGFPIFGPFSSEFCYFRLWVDFYPKKYIIFPKNHEYSKKLSLLRPASTPYYRY